jgi:hypothetical protein
MSSATESSPEPVSPWESRRGLSVTFQFGDAPEKVATFLGGNLELRHYPQVVGRPDPPSIPPNTVVKSTTSSAGGAVRSTAVPKS